MISIITKSVNKSETIWLTHLKYFITHKRWHKPFNWRTTVAMPTGIFIRRKSSSLSFNLIVCLFFCSKMNEFSIFYHYHQIYIAFAKKTIIHALPWSDHWIIYSFSLVTSWFNLLTWTSNPLFVTFNCTKKVKQLQNCIPFGLSSLSWNLPSFILL